MPKANTSAQVAELLRSPIYVSSPEAGHGEAGIVISGDADGGLILYSATDTYDPELGTGTYQILLSTQDGKQYAGGGVVTLDASGIAIASTTSSSDLHSYRFTNGVGGATTGRYDNSISNAGGSGTPGNASNVLVNAIAGYDSRLYLSALAPTGQNGAVQITAQSNTSAAQTLGVFLANDTGTAEYVSLSGAHSGFGVAIGVSSSIIVPSSLLHLKSTAPTFRMEDTTSSAKDLLITTDADATVFQEAAAATDILRLDLANKNVVVNSAALATNATDGFLYITSSAGTPSGTPTAFTGRLPIHIDSTNHELYFNDGSWRKAGSTSSAPVGSAFVTIGTDATLTSERALTGTANQITVTDNGAGSTVVLSLAGPHAFTTQTIHGVLLGQTAGAITATAAGTNGQILVGSTSADPVFATLGTGTGISISAGAGTLTVNNTGVTSNVAGTGISISGGTGAVTITNSGVTSLAGTNNQITASASSGAVTLSTPQNIHTGATPQFARLGLGAAADAAIELLISGTSPQFQMTDTTASAKSLLVKTDANLTVFSEAGGAAANLLVLDLANAAIGVNRTANTAGTVTQLSVAGDHSTSVNEAQIDATGLTDTGKRLSLGVDTTNNRGFIQASKTSSGYYDLLINPGGGLLSVGLNGNPSAQLDIRQFVKTSGSPIALNVVGGAHTTLTIAETNDLKFNLARTVNFAAGGGTIATQRAALFQSPTYTATTDAVTLTKAATLAITAAPTASTNVTITSAYALWVQAGITQLDGAVNVGGTLTLSAQNIATDTTTGMQVATSSSQKLGVWGATPIVRGTAFTQTYSTATHTHATPTASAPPAGGTGATAGAYDTSAHRDAMITSVTNLVTDMANVKQVLNALIDDMQAIGWTA